MVAVQIFAPLSPRLARAGRRLARLAFTFVCDDVDPHPHVRQSLGTNTVM